MIKPTGFIAYKIKKKDKLYNRYNEDSLLNY